MLEAIVTVLRTTGCTRTQAARHVEIHPDTLGTWYANNPAFRRAVDKAESDYDVGVLGRMRAHATKDPRAAQFIAERHHRLRAEWGPKAAEVSVALTGPDGQAPQVEVKHTHGLAVAAGEQLAALAATLDVLVRVGVLGGPGAAVPRLVGPDAAGDTEVVEVHPA